MINNSQAMRVLPKMKGKWVALLLFSFKAYMVIAVPLNNSDASS
jgi:hypothetical protein